MKTRYGIFNKNKLAIKFVRILEKVGGLETEDIKKFLGRTYNNNHIHDAVFVIRNLGYQRRSDEHGE